MADKKKGFLDVINEALTNYNKNTDEAPARRNEHRATEPTPPTEEWPTVGTERDKRKSTKEPTGSSFGVYE